MREVQLLLDILVHNYKHRYLRDVCNSLCNGYLVLTEEGASVPAPAGSGLKKVSSVSGEVLT